MDVQETKVTTMTVGSTTLVVSEVDGAATRAEIRVAGAGRQPCSLSMRPDDFEDLKTMMSKLPKKEVPE